MARKFRKSRRSRRSKGGAALSLANASPLGESLASSWSATMAEGQGGDFLKYHRGQHGGMAPLSSITGSGLDASLRGPAMLTGQDNALSEVRGLSDLQAGGKRHRRRTHGKRTHGKKSRRRGGRRTAHKKSHRRRRTHGKKSRRMSRRKTRRSRGGALTGAPFGGPSMLLSGSAYSQAGLNPGWKSNVEFDAAEARQALQI